MLLQNSNWHWREASGEGVRPAIRWSSWLWPC